MTTVKADFSNILGVKGDGVCRVSAAVPYPVKGSVIIDDWDDIAVKGGSFTADVKPGRARFHVLIGSTSHVFEVVVPDGESADLSELIVNEYPFEIYVVSDVLKSAEETAKAAEAAKASEGQALVYRDAAAKSAEDARLSADNASDAARDAGGSESRAREQALLAQGSAEAANASKLTAGDSASKAQASADAAAGSVEAVRKSASDAAQSASTASGSESEAKRYGEAASASAEAAKTSAEGASTARDAASVSASAAKESEINAKASEVTIAGHASAAKLSETNAKASETAAKLQADRAEGAISTTRWVGDQVEINGQLSPHLTGKSVVNAPLETRVNVADVIVQNRAGLRPDHPYSDPTPEQVTAVKSAVSALMRGKTAVAPEGMEVLEGFDGAAQRNVRVLRSVPGNGLYWGVWVFPVDDKITGVMEAPHPVFDAGSDDIAVKIWEKSPAGTVLAVAGSHRTSPDGLNARDVAHNTKSMWHQITTFIAQPGLPEFQLHGFGDESMPGVGAVVSSGSSPLSAGVIRTDRFVSAAGVATARQWDGSAIKLIGMANIQGDEAAKRGNPFMHIELSKTVRDNPGVFVEAAVSAGFLAGENAALLTNEFPKPVGSVNSRGESATAARADHTHRLVQNDPRDGEIVAREGGGWRSIPAKQVLSNAGGYVKPESGIPVADLAQDLRDAKSAVDSATYSATANTLMKRTSTGAVSVADPTASVHAANKKYVDGIAAAKADVVGGQVPTSQLPAVALTKPQVVGDRSAMLKLTAEEGDVAVVTQGEDKGTYMLGDGDKSQFESWVKLSTPDGGVTSVNGQTGVVNLSARDVGAASADDLAGKADGQSSYEKTGDTVARRWTDGTLQVGDPKSGYHAATKKYVDDCLGGLKIVKGAPPSKPDPNTLYVEV